MFLAVRLLSILFFLTLMNQFAHADIPVPEDAKKNASEQSTAVKSKAEEIPKAAGGDTKDFLVSNDFGPSSCKIESLAQEALGELKAKCNAWLKERKTELGAKYHTGTCNEDCSECTMSMKKCAVHGVAHYSK